MVISTVYQIYTTLLMTPCIDAKLTEERLFCHSRVGGNPEVFDFLASEFLGFRLRGSDKPFCINLRGERDEGRGAS